MVFTAGLKLFVRPAAVTGTVSDSAGQPLAGVTLRLGGTPFTTRTGANGEFRLDSLPAGPSEQARVEPIYESFEGWQTSTAGARSWAALPAQAVKYVRSIEEMIECPVALLSTSPEREDTISMRDPFED